MWCWDRARRGCCYNVTSSPVLNFVVVVAHPPLHSRPYLCLGFVAVAGCVRAWQEPTTGMDPVNRRSVWQLIRELKQHRIVILTTHSMEEADALGDSIAILATGRLRAIGSPLFLKNRFGAGYSLNVIVAPERLQELRELVLGNLPGAEIVFGGRAPGTSAATAVAGPGNTGGGGAAAAGSMTVAVPRSSMAFLPGNATPAVSSRLCRCRLRSFAVCKCVRALFVF